MKQYFAVILLFKCWILSSAEVSAERHHPFYKIISILPKSENIVRSSASSIEFNVKTLEQISEITKKAQSNYDEGSEYNDIADRVIGSVAEEILSGGLDPAVLEDQEIIFEYKPLLITYTGTLTLTHGYIQELSTISRNGEVLVTYSLNTNSYKIEVPLSFRNIIADYNFEMSVRGDTVSGVVYAWAYNVTADYIVELSGATMLPTNKDFSLNIGSLTIDLYSADFDSYKDLLNELVTDLMHDVVVEQTAAIAGGLLNEAVLSAF